MKDYFKFACVYCGQHMDCEPRFRGRQIQCPACQHRIAIPKMSETVSSRQTLPATDTWETCVSPPSVEMPTRYLRRTSSDSMLV
jgi:DNA-directed RNA polymerase subunit RPC12/RpoP